MKYKIFTSIYPIPMPIPKTKIPAASTAAVAIIT